MAIKIEYDFGNMTIRLEANLTAYNDSYKGDGNHPVAQTLIETIKNTSMLRDHAEMNRRGGAPYENNPAKTKYYQAVFSGYQPSHIFEIIDTFFRQLVMLGAEVSRPDKSDIAANPGKVANHYITFGDKNGALVKYDPKDFDQVPIVAPVRIEYRPILQKVMELTAGSNSGKHAILIAKLEKELAEIGEKDGRKL